ncbi:MAG: cupin domain-containing protein [Sporichthyaceae bacterium]
MNADLSEPAVRRLKYVRVFTDADNVTDFGDLDFELVPTVFAPPAPPLAVSAHMPANGVLFLHAPAGWSDAAHPAPARQLVMVLSGEFEGSAAGRTRMFAAGDVALLEDTDGPGHGMTALTDLLLAIVRL